MLIIPVLLINLLVDWYLYRAAKQRCKPVWHKVVLWSSVILTAILIYIIAAPKKAVGEGDLSYLMWGIFGYFSVYIPKYIFVVLDLIGKIPCLFKHKRIKAFGRVGAGLGVLTFCLMWWGVVNRYNTQTVNVDFEDANVPQAFDGFTMVQISDIHTGTFGTDTAFLGKVVKEVNALNPDVILFTGDIVNRHSTELEPFVTTLSGLKAKYGVYSVLGNHDYGDYYMWLSEADKAADLQHLKDLQAKMGWKMLNNESATLHQGGDSIILIGVENIGDPPFPKYGDLDAAYPALDDGNFKILMSHNPAHWVEDIQDSPDKNIALTLSGHTHAMQMELFGLSPAVFRYKTWGGMYDDEDDAHHLYVNIGLGEVGFPARIGATPEITKFTLKRKQ